MQVIFRTKNLIKETVIIIVLLVAIFYPFLHNLASRSFYPDESHWVHTSKYFKLFFLDHDYFNEQWKEFDVYDQPSIGRYIMGFSILVTGHADKFDYIQNMQTWNFSKDKA